MNKKDIIAILERLKILLELHDENSFKINAIKSGIFKFERGKDTELGKGMLAKVEEINCTGKLQEEEILRNQTPVGLFEILNIPGLGPKKVRKLWKDLGVETQEELYAACLENKLVRLNGFGTKTQDAIRQKIIFKTKNAHLFHYALIEPLAIKLLESIRSHPGVSKAEITGPMRRKCELLEQIDILICSKEQINIAIADELQILCPINLMYTQEQSFAWDWFISTGFKLHVEMVDATENNYSTEQAIYEKQGLPYIEPELREGGNELKWAKSKSLPTLIVPADIQGLLHNHSNYSDGKNTLMEMALACKELGYNYLGISDHSKSATYAGGLSPLKVEEQIIEIDKLNVELAPFKIFKGIESDILPNGDLDYESAILEKFDFVVASIHSNLNMDEGKATLRIIKAVENPYTTILGHPTGRLLLNRMGYPIDHTKIIDACSANGVAIEINANPHRLDLDWRWINYCIQKQVFISINPDAHQTKGLTDVQFGIHMARKGGLTKGECLNALSLSEMESYFLNRKPKINRNANH